MTTLLTQLYHSLITAPLQQLYMHGPSFGGYGFWNGKNNVDICAEMTSISSDVWVVNQEDCQDRIDRGFYSLVVSANFVLYVGLLWFGTKTCISYICRRRQLHQHQQQQQQQSGLPCNREVLYVVMPPKVVNISKAIEQEQEQDIGS